MARILVVHEIAANHRRVRESLPEHQILAFRKTAQAMRFLKKNRVDLIVSAVHLNDGDVFDFLHWAKTEGELQEIPFVFFCAEPSELARYVSGAVRSAAQVLGASRYIAMEEFDSRVFRSMIEELLSGDSQPLSEHHLRALEQYEKVRKKGDDQDD